MTSREIPKELASAPQADWVREMQEHFNETGRYRPEDLDRLLGDPTHGVVLSPDPAEMRNVFRNIAKR